MGIPDFPGRHKRLEIVEEFHHQMLLENLEDHGMHYGPNFGILQRRYNGERGIHQRLFSCEGDSFSFRVDYQHLKQTSWMKALLVRICTHSTLDVGTGFKAFRGMF